MCSSVKYLVFFASIITAIYGEDPNHRERDFSGQDRNFRDLENLTGASSAENQKEVSRSPDRSRDSNGHRRDVDQSKQPNDSRFDPGSGK